MTIEELWNWPVTRRSDRLFRGLIQDQYAKKALSSPVPESKEDLDRLIQELELILDRKIDPSEFNPNPAMRNLAKISLNSIW